MWIFGRDWVDCVAKLDWLLRLSDLLSFWSDIGTLR
jgi:hypothetical protein